VAGKKRKKQRKRRQPTAPGRFAIGATVRVKAGIQDPDFPDIPLGGWAGTVQEIDPQASKPTYLVEWNQATLDQMHSVYRQRCERDGLEFGCMWLGDDELEADTGEAAHVEPAANIVRRPLSKRDQDDRIRAILGLTSDDPMPPVTSENLRRYHSHLARELRFPFRARVPFESEEFDEIIIDLPILVTGLLDPDEGDEETGLLWQATGIDGALEGCLDALERVANPGNRRLIQDYSSWFHNCSEPDQIIRPSRPELLLGPANMVPARGLRISAVAQWMIVGLYCGMVLGALLAALEIAWTGAAIGAMILGLAGGWVGALYGKVVGAVNQFRFGALLVGTLGVIGGTLVGAIVGAMIAATVGVLAGAIFGGILGRLFVKLRLRILTTFWGIVVGAGAGAVVYASIWDRDSALTGALIGAATGLVVGALCCLTLIGLIALLGRRGPLNQ
jgi:hypothetical protein